MRQSEKLAITIPTFNRAEFLDYSLSIHIPILRQFNIPIYISDNASADFTRQVVERWQREYQLLFYHRNEQNLGYDANIEKALELPSSDYVWILGDTNNFSGPVLSNIVKNLEKYEDIDVIVINANGRVKINQDKIYTKHEELLSDLGWHLTLLSSLVYSKRVIKKADFRIFYGSYFLQTGIVLDFFSKHEDFRLLWLGSSSIGLLQIHGVKKISWQKQTFEIWLIKWPELILSASNIYPLGSKLKAIKDHNKLSGLFSMKNLFLLKNEGVLNFKSYRTYRRYFRLSLSRRQIIVFTVLLLVPSYAAEALVKIFRLFKKTSLYNILKSTKF